MRRDAGVRGTRDMARLLRSESAGALDQVMNRHLDPVRVQAKGLQRVRPRQRARPPPCRRRRPCLDHGRKASGRYGHPNEPAKTGLTRVPHASCRNSRPSDRLISEGSSRATPLQGRQIVSNLLRQRLLCVYVPGHLRAPQSLGGCLRRRQNSRTAPAIRTSGRNNERATTPRPLFRPVQ